MMNKYLSNISTLPIEPKVSIERDDLIRLISEKFAEEERVVVVSGIHGSGKTILLSQFVRKHSDQCIPYFFKKDYWSRDPKNFLADVCSQLLLIIEGQEFDYSEYDFYALRDQFNLLYRRLYLLGRKLKKKFFFIVDGLDLIDGRKFEENIVDYLPTDPKPWIYLLVSTTHPEKLEFENYEQRISFFSPTETSHYLKSSGIEEESLHREIYAKSQGLPVYLDHIRRDNNGGRLNKDENFEVSEGFSNLLKKDWGRVLAATDFEFEKLYAILVFTEEPFSVEDLSQISEIEKEIVENFVQHNPFVRCIERELVSFVTEAHQIFVHENIKHEEIWASEKLIAYYEQTQKDMYLPELYSKTNKYGQLKSLLDFKKLTNYIQKEGDLYSIRKRIRMVSESALYNNEWNDNIIWTLMSSVISSMSKISYVRDELVALLALGDYDDAISLVYSTVLEVDKLQNFATLCMAMNKDGIEIDPKIQSDIFELVDGIKVDEYDIDKLSEIVTDLFYVHNKAAMHLMEKIVGENIDARALDNFLATIYILLEDENADIDNYVQDNVAHEGLKEFLKVSPKIVRNKSIENVLDEVETIEDAAAKIFFLRSWCNSNRKTKQSYKVIKKALAIVSETNFAISQRHLRHFSENLLFEEYTEEIEELIREFVFLQETTVRSPIEEYMRLQLNLAVVESKNSEDKAAYRLLEIYSEIDDIEDLSVQCYCYSRMWVTLDSYSIREDLDFIQEIKTNLPGQIFKFLDVSSKHFSLTKRIIKSLVLVDEELAIKAIESFNVQERKDKGYKEFLINYLNKIENDSNHLEAKFTYVLKIIDRIDDSLIRDRLLIRLIKLYSKFDVRYAKIFTPALDEIRDIPARFLAYAYFLSFILNNKGGKEEIEQAYTNLIELLNGIDGIWSKIHYCFVVVDILAPFSKAIARKVFNEAIKIKGESPFSNNEFTDIYINTLLMAIRVLADISKSNDLDSEINMLCTYISKVPSKEIQLRLYSDLSIQLKKLGFENKFKSIVEERIIPMADSLENNKMLRSKVFWRLSNCLMAYNSDYLLDQSQLVHVDYQEKLSLVAMRYLITKSPLYEYMSLKKYSYKFSPSDISDALKIANHVNTDVNIYSVIDSIIDGLLIQDSKGKFKRKAVFSERESLKFLKELLKIVNAKLPDKKNITHEGFLIITLSKLRMFYDIVSIRSKDANLVDIATWAKLIQQSRDIGNLSDKVFVLSTLASDLAKVNNLSLAHRLLDEAKEVIQDIPSTLERIERMLSVAEVFKEIEDEESGQHFLEEAMKSLSEVEWDESKEDLIERLLNQAHNINPELAGSLTSLVDNPFVQRDLELDRYSKDVLSNPKKVIEDVSIKELRKIRGSAAKEFIGLLNANKITLSQPQDVWAWTETFLDGEFQETSSYLHWAIENEIRIHRDTSAPQLQEVFNRLVSVLDMEILLGKVLLGSDAVIDYQFNNPIEPSATKFFSVGEQDSALNYINSWIAKNATSYIKIYDPYFTPKSLDLLSGIDENVRIFILTELKSHNVKWIEKREKIEAAYSERWKELFPNSNHQATINVFGIKSSGKSPMHDRYYIADGAKGLNLGTSDSGFGKSDSSIRSMEENETLQAENDRVDKMLFSPPALYKEEALEVVYFICNSK